MDPARLAELAATIRRFFELPGVREEFHGLGMPHGGYFAKALEALAELERMAEVAK